MLTANKIIEACLLFSYVSSLPNGNCKWQSLPTGTEVPGLHETVIDFVDDMLEHHEHSRTDKQYAWNCLGSLKDFFLQDGNYGGEKNCTDIFSKMDLDKMDVVTGTSDRNCPDLFSSMEKYKGGYVISKCSTVPRDFKLTYPFLKECHKIEKETQRRKNAGS